MTVKFRLLYSFLVLLLSVSAYPAITMRTSELRDSLERVLPSKTTSDDKISVLYNIYDLSTRPTDRVDALRRLYNEAEYCDRAEVQLDVMTHLANIYRDNDSALVAIEKELDNFVDTDRKREVMLFVAMSRSDIESKKDNDNDDNLEKLFKRENLNAPADPYERALMLYTLCSRLSRTTSGELLEQYTERLEHQIERLPLPSGSVRNLIYTRAAPIFTNNQNYRKAVEIDKKMINIIDSLSDSYHSHGRPYRNLNTSRFVCYRRLLGNYKGLTPSEIEAIYAKIQDLAKVDPRIANDINMVERSNIFYYLATERYAQAVEAIKRQIDNPANKEYRFYYLNALVDAAEKIGDKQTQLDAAVELNQFLRNEMRRKAAERYRELEIIYDVNALKEANAAAATAHEESKIRAERIFAIGLAVAVVTLLILLVLLIRKNRKVKRMALKQAHTSERLRKERNELRQTQEELIAARDEAKSADKLKTDFINNMSHEVKTPLAAIVEYSKLFVDCVPEDKTNYLQRFANIIDLNSKLIITLLNDVLDIASLEHGTMNIDYKPSNVYDMCAFALDNLFENEGRTSKGVEVVFNTEKRPDAVVETDPQRVGQVLLNLLSNADKFTDRGRISLDFDYDSEHERLTFIVTDTGIGVPASQSEAIFSRFRKLDNTSPGCGLGLYISRLLAKLLDGDITLDTSYHGGARFIFSISAKA